jgi:hypothetical protein
MKDHPDARLARVIEAWRGRLSEQTARRARRAEHDRVVAEIPRFLGRLSSAIGEINDRLSETDLILALVGQAPQSAAEASFRVVVKDDELDDVRLDVAVEGRGQVHAVIVRDGRQRALPEADVFTESREDMIGWLITLLETRYLDDAPDHLPPKRTPAR